MGATGSGIEAADQTSAEALLSAFKTISPSERRKHASVLNYWLSIRGDKEFPPLHDLDPLELSDAGPNSILFELISGGHDAEVRHFGEALKDEGKVERIIDAPHPSLLSSIAKKLPIVAISRDFLAFEDEYAGERGDTRCWVTLLPLSAGGAWVDYVYALVSLEAEGGKAAKKKGDSKKAKAEDVTQPPESSTEESGAEAVAESLEPSTENLVVETEEPLAESVADQPLEDSAVDEPDEEAPQPCADEPVAETLDEPSAEPEPIPEFLQAAPENDESPTKSRPGFSKLFDNLVGLTGFYGHGYKVDADQPEPVATDEAPEVEAEHLPAEHPISEEEIQEEAVAESVAEPLAESPEDPVAEPLAESPEDPVAEPRGTEIADEASKAPVAEEPMTESAEKEVEQPAIDETVAAEQPLEIEKSAAVLAVAEPAAENPDEQLITEHAVEAASAPEGSLQHKLADVRAKADEAQQAKLRATAALYEGLSAAYDFALDAEDAPEDYLKLVEAQGLKIQLRSPMKPVVKLAFADTCDDSTIKQLEAVLAWALDNELPRGSLLGRIEEAGGIGPILSGEAKAA